MTHTPSRENAIQKHLEQSSLHSRVAVNYTYLHSAWGGGDAWPGPYGIMMCGSRRGCLVSYPELADFRRPWTGVGALPPLH